MVARTAISDVIQVALAVSAWVHIHRGPLLRLGPYLVVPLLGPSTLRDAGALAVTSAALSQLVGADWLAGVGVGDAFVTYAGRHEALKQVDAAALDSYAVLRSAYLQRRAASCAIDRAQLLAREAAENSDDR